ncbi:MAG: hypothetical protein ACK5P7_04130 [Bdellovibrio sp.]
MKLLLNLVPALVLTFSAPAVLAKNSCHSVFSKISQSAAVRKLVSEDAYMQWLKWEQTANLKQYHKPTTTIEVPLVRLSPAAVDVVVTSDAPSKLINLFKTEQGDILWAKHPYNLSPEVPFRESPSTDSISVYMTSSRSLALTGDLRGYTIKLATDHPHGPRGEYQPSKIKTNDDIDSALIHTNHMKEVDQLFGVDPVIMMLGEVMTVAEKKTGIGMVVRDVRATDDGNYYLPALSIPYVGREIAQINGTSFEAFFERAYAQLLGEAKARLLLRTGLQMATPNPQNMLLQLDRNLKPTGKLVFRDVSDAYLVDVVAKGLNFKKKIELDIAAGYPPKVGINPFWSNSLWRFDEAGKDSVSTSTIESWAKAHNRAFIEYIERELKIDTKEDTINNTQDEMDYVYMALKSDLGQAKLLQYRKRLEAQEQRQHQRQQREFSKAM